ncbi:MAG TPA: glycosyltransferase family 2 protein, partial [Dehalococcoidia bacterium]|nr:glycosyltransferase family 2 protein [Dehalococcoidia bacterium]
MKTAVIIPALDEEAAIGSVLEAVPQGMACVVVDNGSRDRTAEVAERHGAVVVREPRRGYGSACLAGIAALEADPPETVIFMDGDCTFDPGEILRLLQGIADGFDLVLGSRIMGGRDNAMPFHAVLANRVFALLLRYYGLKLTDIGPFRAVRYGTLSSLGMADWGYGFSIE